MRHFKINAAKLWKALNSQSYNIEEIAPLTRTQINSIAAKAAIEDELVGLAAMIAVDEDIHLNLEPKTGHLTMYYIPVIYAKRYETKILKEAVYLPVDGYLRCAEKEEAEHTFVGGYYHSRRKNHAKTNISLELPQHLRKFNSWWNALLKGHEIET